MDRDLAEAQKQYERSQEQLLQMRQQIRQQTGRAQASSDAIREDLAHLEEQRQELQLDMEAKAARMAALSENIAKLSAQVEQKVKDDAVAAELNKIVDARDKQVQRIQSQVKSGLATDAELSDAIAKLAEARARVLERHAEAAERAGADTVSDWNRELMSLSVDAAEIRARLESLSARLQKMQGVTDQLDELDAARQARDQAHAAMEQAQEQGRDLARQLQSMPISRTPRAIVVRSEDRTGDRPAHGAAEPDNNEKR